MALVASNPFPNGTKAPNFSLLNVVSNTYNSLQSLKGEKGTLVMFICNHCPFVIHVNDELVRISNDYIKKGIPSYQAFLKVQTHLLALGKAYSVELAYNIFCDHYQQLEDLKYRALLEKVGCLYALDQINQDAKWFLEQGYVGGTKSKAIRQRVERLSTELRPHIEVLVDGFGIPEHCLTAPITK